MWHQWYIHQTHAVADSARLCFRLVFALTCALFSTPIQAGARKNPLLAVAQMACNICQCSASAFFSPTFFFFFFAFLIFRFFSRTQLRLQFFKFYSNKKKTIFHKNKIIWNMRKFSENLQKIKRKKKTTSLCEFLSNNSKYLRADLIKF